MILLGDLNVAPLEHDVWSHKQLIKVVSFHPSFETLNLCPASFGTPEFNQMNDAARTAHNTANPQYVELSVCIAATMK